MKHLLLTLLLGATIAVTALDAAAQGGRGGGGRGGGGFPGNNNGNGGDNGGAQNAPPPPLPQAPAGFGAPVPGAQALPTAPAGFGAPVPGGQALPTAPPGAFGATTAAPKPAAGDAAKPAATTATAVTPAVPAAQQAGSAAARAKNTVIKVVDNKISVQATSVELSQFVKLLDSATGKSSRIRDDKAVKDQKISVRFEDLSYDEAVRKIFQAVALDYILVENGVFITGKAGAVSTAAAATPQAAQSQPINNPISGPPTINDGLNPFANPAGEANVAFGGQPPAAGGQPAPPTPAGATPAAPPAPVTTTVPPPQDFSNPFSSVPFGAVSPSPAGGGLGNAPAPGILPVFGQ